MATLHWALRDRLKDMREDGRLALLTALILHANIRLRCWASTDTLAFETGWSSTSVIAAKKWLGEHGAFVLVPYRKRVAEELALPRRQHIYQLTGVLKFADEITPYLFMPPEAQAAVETVVTETLLAKTLATEISATKTLVTEVKGSSSFQGSSIPEGGSPKQLPVVDVDYAEVAKVYEDEIGLLSPFIGSELKDLLKDYPKDWVIDAIRVAVGANKRNLNYMRGILRNWKANGRNTPPSKPDQTQKPAKTPPASPAPPITVGAAGKLRAAQANKKGEES